MLGSKLQPDVSNGVSDRQTDMRPEQSAHRTRALVIARATVLCGFLSNGEKSKRVHHILTKVYIENDIPECIFLPVVAFDNLPSVLRSRQVDILTPSERIYKKAKMYTTKSAKAGS